MQGDTEPSVGQPAEIEIPAAIYDPGEVGREAHNKGDRFTVAIANFFAWIFPILMLAICAQVVMRQAGFNQAWLDDFQWWLYGSAVLVGVAYAVTTNSHVRVDIFYDNYPEERKARIDCFALVWLFLPFIILSWDVTLGYAFSSVLADEGSDSPNGLHNLWILKVFMNFAFLLTAIAVWAAYVRRLRVLTTPTLGKQLVFAFPSVMFMVNLWIYYTAWIVIWATAEEGTQTRQIGRHAFFDEFDIGPWEIKYTIVLSIALTLILIGAALVRDARRAK